MSKTERNGMIEVMRFIVAITIVLYHYAPYTGFLGIKDFSSSGWQLGVDFFFMLSGVLLMQTEEKRSEQNAFALAYHKLKSFYLPLFLSFVFENAIIAYLKNRSFLKLMYKSIPSFLMLQPLFVAVFA